MSNGRVPVEPPVTRVIQDRFDRCVYRPGQISRCPARVPAEPLSPGQLDILLNEGDQRVGGTVFRTTCPFCHACEPVRIDVASFTLSHSHRRVWARNERDLRVDIGPPALSRRRVGLWNRHRRVRGLLTDQSRRDPLGYHEWLVESCAPTVEVRYTLDDRLVGLSLLDLGSISANSAYHYYDPSLAKRSIGVYSVLKEIELCHSLGIRWYYLGLWAADSVPLQYKSKYYPHERFVRGTWKRFESREQDPAAFDPQAYAAAASTRPSGDGPAIEGFNPKDWLDSDGPGDDSSSDDPTDSPPGAIDLENEAD